MIKIAVYGKGGIGKSTTVSNVAVALAEKGLKVMQIGCDPKADSTIALRHAEAVPTVLDLFREKKQNLRLEDMVRTGYQGVICVEAGGPTPGLGCAGRGIITALEKLKEENPGAEEELFTRFWVLRESYVKKTGEGLGTSLEGLAFSGISGYKGKKNGKALKERFFEWEYDGYRIAVCEEKDGEPELVVCSRTIDNCFL